MFKSDEHQQQLPSRQEDDVFVDNPPSKHEETFFDDTKEDFLPGKHLYDLEKNGGRTTKQTVTFDRPPSVRRDERGVAVSKKYKNSHAVYVGSDPRFSLHKLGNVHVEDHFSLPRPSSDLTYQLTDRHTFSLGTKSIVLERTNDQTVTVKYSDDATAAQFIFRGICTLLSVLMVGFMFAFFLEVILFLFLGLVIESGMTTNRSFAEDGIIVFLGTACAIPLFVRGLSNAMVSRIAA